VSQFTDHVVYLVRGVNGIMMADSVTKWDLIRDGLSDAIDKMLQFSRRHQCDWFTEVWRM